MSILDDHDDIDIYAVSAKSAAMSTGLYLGLAGIFFTLVYNMFDLVDYTGQTSNMIPNLVMYAVTFAIMYYGLTKFRDTELRGRITLGKCISMGTLAGVFYGIISAVFMYIFFTFIQPDLINNILEQMIEGFEEQGMDDDTIETAMGFTRNIMSPIGMSAIGLLGSIFWGFISSLIIGLFVKTE